MPPDCANSLADFISVDDEEKLREKVHDALNVYNDYLKSSQSGDSNIPEATAPEESRSEAAPEEVKA